MLEGPFELTGIEPLKLIGSGGFGEVWLARQINIDRQVAMKVGYSPIDDETIRIRFERECIALGRLSGHANIVDVFTAGQLDDGRPYLMLEYIDGGTLWHRLKKGHISENELRFTAIELADALSMAHGAGVLHRDLKPENILLRKNGEAVLGDFGIARLQDGTNTTSHPITASVAYAAPEILTGKEATAASDLYGLGMCLLTAAIRGVPFMKSSDESVHPIMERVLGDDPPDLREHGYSDGFADLVSSLLAKQGKQRPESAEAVRNEIFRLDEVDPLPDKMRGTNDGSAEASDVEHPPDITTTSSRGRLGRSSTSGLRARTISSTPPKVLDLEPEPTRPPPVPTGRARRSMPSADRWRLIGAAVGAVVLACGIAAFALSSELGGLIGGNDVAVTPPLVLPLTNDDLQLGAAAEGENDSAGPDSTQFCDNTPTTAGLVDWIGTTNSGPAGFPVVFQQLALFGSVGEATDYVDSYLAGIDCEGWAIPNGNEQPIVVMPTPLTIEPPVGDQTIEVTFATADGLTLSGQVALVRNGPEVYTLSITSLDDGDVSNFDSWLNLATNRLGY